MTVDTEADVTALKHIGTIVADCLQHMAKRIEPGMTTRELDEIGAAYLARFGAQSAPVLFYDFPGHTCISVGAEAAHGIPGDRVIKPGEFINIDVSAEKNNYVADTGATFIVPPAKPMQRRLCRATRLARDRAIGRVKAGRKLSEIGRAIDEVAREQGYSIILNLASHGVGRTLHEYPRSIPSYYDRWDERIMTKGMVFTIEPFLSTGTQAVRTAPDGWTLINDPGCWSAQYEHTLICTDGEAMVLTIPSTPPIGFE